MILDGDDADLRNFFVTIGRGGETKAVGTDDTAAVENDFIADATAVVDTDAGIEETVFADTGTLFDDAVGINLSTRSDSDTRSDVGKGAHVDVIAQRGVGFDTSQGVNAGTLLSHGFIERKQTSDGFVGVVDANQCGRNGALDHEIAIDEYDTGRGLVEVVGVFGIGQKGDGSGLPFFDLGKGFDGGFGVAFNAAAKVGGELLRGKFHGLKYNLLQIYNFCGIPRTTRRIFVSFARECGAFGALGGRMCNGGVHSSLRLA